MDRKYGRKADGTFTTGNPGKPKGTRNRSTRAALDLLDGESEALTRRAVELALDGDTTALRLCMERLVPPRRHLPISIRLPEMKSAADAADVCSTVLNAVADGEVTPADGARVMHLVETYRRTLEATDFERRLKALERDIDAQS